ncbi:DUF2189 domain-containing protein [Sphingosinicella humi]|uniref:DUF2189 domain-containing protein n=1 Tax=Allosphingosinicella humi TaxID=2068657 RepID=A0A2U2J5L5_9SPHN|nr:DUF2189 domain-containing protein [Sphingosinicella humi]PWG03629.1 hypothetical protein DF286_12640 [Sphingosinicella humi]
MAVAHPVSAASPARTAPVRTIRRDDLRIALRDGWADFMSMRGDLIFIGLLYPLIGIIAATVTMGGALLPLFFPIAAGISLLGPIVAIGFYELARRREDGLESGWSHFLDVRKRPSADGISVVAALLVTIFMLWVAAAGALYVGLWGMNAPESVGAFLTRLFTTPEGWGLIVIGNLVGLGFAAVVLAVSVVSLPMLVDCEVDAGTAVRTSIAAFRRNTGLMMRWGLIVAALLVLGSIPLFIGLAAVLPWLGYATWHLYTRLVDRAAFPHCQD